VIKKEQKMKTILKDMLGKELKVGDRVALHSYRNLGLAVGIVEKLGRVRAQVRPIQTRFLTTDPTIESIGADDLIKI
jgi:hypothetical protein